MHCHNECRRYICTRIIQGPPGPQGPTGATGPQGPTGSTGSGPSGLNAYGGRYNATSQLVFFTAADTYVRVTLNTMMATVNVTQNADSTITIQQGGDYEINYNILMSTSESVDVACGVRRNGALIPSTRGSQTLSFDPVATLSHDGRITGSSIVTLAAGDVLDLAVAVLRVLPPGLDAAINGLANASLSVKKLN